MFANLQTWTNQDEGRSRPGSNAWQHADARPWLPAEGATMRSTGDELRGAALWDRSLPSLVIPKGSRWVLRGAVGKIPGDRQLVSGLPYWNPKAVTARSPPPVRERHLDPRDGVRSCAKVLEAWPSARCPNVPWFCRQMTICSSRAAHTGRHPYAPESLDSAGRSSDSGSNFRACCTLAARALPLLQGPAYYRPLIGCANAAGRQPGSN